MGEEEDAGNETFGPEDGKVTVDEDEAGLAGLGFALM